MSGDFWVPEGADVDGSWKQLIQVPLGHGGRSADDEEHQWWLTESQAASLAEQLARSLAAGLSPWARARAAGSSVTVAWESEFGPEEFVGSLMEMAVEQYLDFLQTDVAESTTEPWPRSTSDQRLLLGPYVVQHEDHLQAGFGTGPEDSGGLHLPALLWRAPPEED